MHEDDYDPDAPVWAVLCDGKVREIHPADEDARGAVEDYRREEKRLGLPHHFWEVLGMNADSAEEAMRDGRRVR